MDRIVVRGGARLSGEVAVSGSKNSTLALMAAALLADGVTVLRRVPRLRDVEAMLELLRALGAGADWDPADPTWSIDALGLNWSPLRHRAQDARLLPGAGSPGAPRQRSVSEPGGCAIGVRPVDQHLKGLEALGAKIRLDHGYVEASAARLRGAHVAFDMSTVNGTQNVMMAAVLAEGRTVIENAAREPEVAELALLTDGAEARRAATASWCAVWPCAASTTRYRGPDRGRHPGYGGPVTRGDVRSRGRPDLRSTS
jgi:UDP-N-acetylglucosamine 1-carboxyvinyltransferase